MSHKDAIHEEEYKGLNIYIVPDDDPQASDPMDFDMLGKQVYWHRNYNLGHCYKETNKYSPMEWFTNYLHDNWKDIEQSEGYENWCKGRKEWEDEDVDTYIDEWMSNDLPLLTLYFEKRNLVIPVSAYEHGGITISASGRRAGWDRFDSGQLGFVYVSHKDIIKEYGSLDLERAEKTLRSEVETYDDYLTGNVYGYIIEDENDEHLDSCWGFLGDYKYCLEEAKSAADWHAEQKEKELKLYDERMVG